MTSHPRLGRFNCLGNLICLGLALSGCSDTQYPTSENFTSYKYLSTETLDPFESHREKYKPEELRSIKKFDSVRSCLVKSEHAKPKPDIGLINWKRLRSLSAAEVCIWRALSSFDNMAQKLEWLTFHDFEISAPLKPAHTGLPYWKEETFIMFAARDLKKTDPLLKTKGLKPYSESISLRFDGDGKLLAVNFMTSVK